MTFFDANLADDQHRRMLGKIPSGRQIVHERAIEFGQSVKIELIECLVGSEAGPAQPGGELLLVTSCNLVLDEQGV
jgi:hypothetical protein